MAKIYKKEIRRILREALEDDKVFDLCEILLDRLGELMGQEIFEIYIGGESLQYYVGVYCPEAKDRKHPDELQAEDVSFFMRIVIREVRTRNVNITVMVGDPLWIDDPWNEIYLHTYAFGQLVEMEGEELKTELTDVVDTILDLLEEWCGIAYDNRISEYKKKTRLLDQINLITRES